MTPAYFRGCNFIFLKMLILAFINQNASIRQKTQSNDARYESSFATLLYIIKTNEVLGHTLRQSLIRDWLFPRGYFGIWDEF